MERKSVLSLQRSSLGTSWLRAKTTPTSSDDSTSRTPRLFDFKCQGIWIERELRELYYFFRYFFRNQIQRLPWTPLQGLHDFSISHGKGYGKALISNSSNDLILTDWLKKISDKLDVMDQSRCLHWLLHQRTS
ncbi:hypothetical protein B9Z55_002567 [Caenorhabditis nigoni]|uniref:Uncharacterized protein n=1 Tax=Caenorhabditis nigoni TaxID=1611254 RepID=A0A2G5VL13_9PELO|nr:hypothetical protein B9Z55_002567 [Caenorhabditis nigoni]